MKISVTVKKYVKNFPILFILAAYIAISGIFIPYFLSIRNIVNILVQACDLIIVSCGLMFILLNGSIDFSITATMGLGSIIGASIMTSEFGSMEGSNLGIVAAILTMFFIGIAIGGLNGLFVVKFRMPSFIASMSTFMVFSGLALVYSKSESITNLPKSFLFIGDGKVLGVPLIIIITVVIVTTLHFILSSTYFGRSIYAIGTNPKAAFISGLSVKKNIFTLFIISGVLAALAGIMSTARIGAGKPVIANERLLDIVAGVIIGGTSITGGIGTVLGTVMGAVFIIILNNSLNLLGVSWYIINIIKGFLILFIAITKLQRSEV